MIEINCIQGSREWHQARLGLVTASEVSRIITPKGALSKSDDEPRVPCTNSWPNGLLVSRSRNGREITGQSAAWRWKARRSRRFRF